MRLVDFAILWSCQESAKERGIELEIDDLLASLDDKQLSDAVIDRFNKLCEAQDNVPRSE